MFYIREESKGLFGVVDTADCVLEFVSKDVIQSLGIPDNELIYTNINQSCLLSGNYDRPVLNTIVHDAKSNNIDSSLFSRMSIPSIDATKKVVKWGRIFKVFNYYDTNGFVVILVDVLLEDGKHKLVLKTDGVVVQYYIGRGDLSLAEQYPCAAGQVYNRLYRGTEFSLQPSDIYISFKADFNGKRLFLCLNDMKGYFC